MKVWMIQMMFPFKRGWFSGSSCSFSGVKNRWFPPHRPKPFLSAEGIPQTLMTSPSILSDGVGMWCGDVRYVITARTATFLVGNPYKPWFATITGKGENPRYVFKDVLLPGWKKSIYQISGNSKCLNSFLVEHVSSARARGKLRWKSSNWSGDHWGINIIEPCTTIWALY